VSEPAGAVRPARVRRLRLRRVRQGVGVSCIIAGVALIGTVAYQLWGTGIATSHAQAGFRHQIQTFGFPPRAFQGRAIGYLDIPRIHLDMVFVQGVGADALAKGPGHYPRSPLPGSGGNVAIAGHRTTHLHPFWSLDQIEPGDRILIQTRDGAFEYRVIWQRTVAMNDWSVIKQTPVASLTLTTCTPRFTSRQRLVVRAVQVGGPNHGNRPLVLWPH
jgi:sortase A